MILDTEKLREIVTAKYEALILDIAEPQENKDVVRDYEELRAKDLKAISFVEGVAANVMPSNTYFGNEG